MSTDAQSGRKRPSRTWAAAVLAAAVLVATAAPAAASGARVPPSSVQGDCDSDSVPVVVASDVAAQSDIYSAVTLAGVLGDACIVLAGARGDATPADQQARLDAAAAGGYVVGGQAAVPDGKIADRTMARLGGADRWETALLVGTEAADPGSAPTTTVAADVEFIPAPGSSSGTASTRVRVPPASVQGDCGSDTTPVVVASDLAAQSDIYSAVTLAGVLGDACIVLAGARDEPMPSSQQNRLDAANAGGYVVGGLAAVPDGKIAGRDMARLGGLDRWATALLVGKEAAEPGRAHTMTIREAEETEEAEDAELVIPPNEPFWRNYLKLVDFSYECGFWSSSRSGPGECETSEDTQLLQEEYNALLGCTFELLTGRCQGFTGIQQEYLFNILACPENWWFADEECYHPSHPNWQFDRYDGVSLPE